MVEGQLKFALAGRVSCHTDETDESTHSVQQQADESENERDGPSTQTPLPSLRAPRTRQKRRVGRNRPPPPMVAKSSPSGFAPPPPPSIPPPLGPGSSCSRGGGERGESDEPYPSTETSWRRRLTQSWDFRRRLTHGVGVIDPPPSPVEAWEADLRRALRCWWHGLLPATQQR